MTLRIPREEWAKFFDDLSKRRYEWRTDVEVLSEEIGDQLLSEGLPLGGITAETKSGVQTIEILLGNNTGHHQTHNISDPTSVAFLANQDGQGGIVEIEESDGTKTLITIIEPMPIEAGYGGFRVAKP